MSISPSDSWDGKGPPLPDIHSSKQINKQPSLMIRLATFWCSDHWLLRYMIGNASTLGSGTPIDPISSSFISKCIDEFPRFIIAVLRGSGQVVFMNNPWAGLFILIGLFIQSGWIAFMGVIGLVSSTATCLILGFNYSLYQGGIFGYNGLLVGLALATFDNGGDNHNALIPLVVFLSVFSSLLVAALGDIMSGRNIPALTLPFNLAATMVLLGGSNFTRFGFSGLSGEFVEPNIEHTNLSEYTAHVLFYGTLRGFGQVFLADNPVSGLLIAIGMIICSPIGFVTAFIGSFFGALTGVWVGASPIAIKTGLWSYNALLGATAIHGVFYICSVQTFIFSILCACGCAMFGGSLAISFSLTGLPTMTYPFCIITLIFLLLQRSNAYGIEAIPLAHVTTPEIHYFLKIKNLEEIKKKLIENDVEEGGNSSPKKLGLRRFISYNDGYSGNKQLSNKNNKSHQTRPVMASRFPSFRSMQMDFGANKNNNDDNDDDEGERSSSPLPPVRLPQNNYPSEIVTAGPKLGTSLDDTTAAL
jgi:solute carrier family 14 (urea transporter)